MCRMCLVIYQQTSANPANTIHVETVFIWKFTSLNGVLKRRFTAKGTSVTNCEVLQLVLDEKYRIAVQRIFCRHYYTLVALVLTALLFAFSFCKKKKQKNKKKKQENWFHLREIRPQDGFQLRNPNPDFMDFLFTFRLGNPKEDLQNYSREQWSCQFAKYACACKTAVLKHSFSNPFSDFPIER